MFSAFPHLKKRIYIQAKQLTSNGNFGIPAVHAAHFKTAYAMFVDKPFIGHGPKTFRMQCNDIKFKYGYIL